ncbi:MAG TPA: cytochrome c biogenesis protein ResB, partial [Paraburkholderia sp.]
TVDGTTRATTAATLGKLASRLGYRFVTRESDGATLIAGKRGALTRLGYIFAHLAIVVICIGGLLDSNLPIKLQMWMFDKTPIRTNGTISQIGPEHRLGVSNPTFRGDAWVPEGQYVSTAILNEPNGALIQDLPFSIELKKFIVDYYSTGMPKLFASDIVVIDHKTGQRVPARVEVNKPFEYDGVSIYQSSFQDGGSQLQMTGWPMTGANTKSFPFGGTVSASAPLPASAPGVDGQTIEFADFRAINVENISAGGGANDVRGVAHESLKEAFDERLGSGAKTSKPLDLHNIGPSVQYKVRDKDGQAREYNNYMLPVDIDGAKMFLAGMRVNPDDPFRYLRIPADSAGTPREWMLLRAAFADPKLREAAAQRFAERSVSGSNAQLQQHLRESASRVLALFAGAESQPGQAVDPQTAAGFQAVAAFIDKSVPKDQQEKAAGLLMRMLEGATWDLWQLARAQVGEPELTPDAQAARFVQDSINAVSDSFLYGSPVYLQLDSFRQIQASVFQLTRAPGKKVVYLGSLLLVAGIFSMFYVRERRLWFWLKDNGNRGVDVIMAMSTARRTLDFEKEFVRTRDAVARSLGSRSAQSAPPAQPPAATDAAGTDHASRNPRMDSDTDSDDTDR